MSLALGGGDYDTESENMDFGVRQTPVQISSPSFTV